MNCAAQVMRYRALRRKAEHDFQIAKSLPAGDERDETIRDAVASLNRADEITGGGA